MNTAEYSDLPSEIIDVVFDELWNSTLTDAPEHNQSILLQNCLPVSTDFRHRILSRFCSVVFLYSPCHGDHGISSLSKVISQPLDSRLAGIGHYIKHLSLQLTCEDTGLPNSEVLGEILRDLSNQDLVHIIEGLHGEHFGVAEFSLGISTMFAWGSQAMISVAWADIPVGFRSAIQSLLRSPHLVHLSLENLVLLPDTFFSGSHIKYLSIQQSPHIYTANSAGKGLDLTPVSVLPFPSLVELHTDHSYKCDSNFLPASMLDKLQVFTELPTENLHSEKSWYVLGLAASSLVEIHIDHEGELVKPPESFNLGLVPNLKVFEYSRRSSSLHPFDPSNDQTLSILFQLFNITESMECLESMAIHFTLQEDFIDKPFIHRIITDHRWALLDPVLSNRSLFLCLSRFGVDIQVTFRDAFSDFDADAFMDTTNELFRSSFPHILKKQSISFNPLIDVRSEYLNEEFSEYEDEPGMAEFEEDMAGSLQEWDSFYEEQFDDEDGPDSEEPDWDEEF